MLDEGVIEDIPGMILMKLNGTRERMSHCRGNRHLCIIHVIQHEYDLYMGAQCTVE